jgi:cytochrome c551/c552
MPSIKYEGMFTKKKTYFSRLETIILILLTVGCAMSFSLIPALQENHSPVVRITSPVNKSAFRSNTNVPYIIQVSDKEDGNSEYDEINSHEVLMHVMYVPDTLKATQYRNGNVTEEDPRAITLMKTSTCFSCHTSRNKLIGPSFDRIAAKYAYSEEGVHALTQKIIHGSIGSWGEVQMPSNTDLKPEEIQEVVRWILRNNKDVNSFYQVGLQGTMRMKEKNQKDTPRGVYVLTASYIDRGLAGNASLKKRGQHSIIIKLQ